MVRLSQKPQQLEQEIVKIEKDIQAKRGAREIAEAKQREYRKDNPVLSESYGIQAFQIVRELDNLIDILETLTWQLVCTRRGE